MKEKGLNSVLLSPLFYWRADAHECDNWETCIDISPLQKYSLSVAQIIKLSDRHILSAR